MSARDTSIDVLRGLFILSMTVSHLSADSLADKVTHAALWVDGAIGFVTLSGLVLGVVYRRTHDRTHRVPYARALRRARLLYVVQATTLLLALAVSTVSVRDVGVGRAADHGGWWAAMGMVATMRMPAQYLDVLPMYVVLLVLAVPALALLASARTGLLLGLAGAVYVLATVFPEIAVPPGVHFNWAAWQLPFVLGLVTGWNWRERAIAERLRSRPAVVLAGAVAAACFVTVQAFGRLGVAAGSDLGRVVGSAFGKFNLGPAHVLFGFAIIALGYALVGALRDAGRLTAPLTWLSVLGSRSLDAFVILCLAVIVLPAVLRYESSSTTAMLLVGVVLAAQTGWIGLRRRRGHRTGTPVRARHLPRVLPTV